MTPDQLNQTITGLRCDAHECASTIEKAINGKKVVLAKHRAAMTQTDDAGVKAAIAELRRINGILKDASERLWDIRDELSEFEKQREQAIDTARENVKAKEAELAEAKRNFADAETALRFAFHELGSHSGQARQVVTDTRDLLRKHEAECEDSERIAVT